MLKAADQFDRLLPTAYPEISEETPGTCPEVINWRYPPYMILGITGSFGAGKSTVREEFSALGWHFFDADKVCHDIYSSRDGEFFTRIVDIWESDIIAPDGSIDRKKLAGKVFGKPDELAKLTALLYPELDRRLEEQIIFCREKNINGAFEIPLLFEKNYTNRFDAVLSVWGASEIRHERLKTMRHFSDEEISRRESQQMPSDEKLERADFALINNGSRELLHKQILIFTEKIKSWKKK